MISWALRRGSKGSEDAPGPDDTQIEAPDTPAPVFAVRALKTALFGTPAPRERAAKEKVQQSSNPASSRENMSPIKPPGILLTPGTGTTRRKRVSFGYGVKEGAADTNPAPSAMQDEVNGNTDNGSEGGISRPKTRLTQAMENARRNGGPNTATGVTHQEDAWEEVDEDSEADLDPDVTVDLNEPHSRSGKYWKGHFETYHADAKAEMEKLVKYKQLAKSYAKKKDEEALDLNQRLKEEQEKVRQMEKKVSEMGRQVALRAKKSGGEYDPGLVDELTKQTALALEYKKQVEELEDFFLEQTGDKLSEVGSLQQRRIASPRTQRTLIDTQRELRKARSQARELERLREDRDRIKSELKFAEQRSAKLVEENRKLSADLTKSTSKAQSLERSLKEAEDENLQKDGELKKLREDYEKLKEDAKARYVEARQVLQKKNEILSELQDEVASLRAKELGSKWTSQAKSLGEKLKTGGEKINAPDRESALKFFETAEEESTLLLKQLSELRKVSIQRGLITPSAMKMRPRSYTDAPKVEPYEDEALVSSRALREKLEAEKRDSWVLTDRGNLQDSRSSASSGRSAHEREQEPVQPSRQAERKSWTAGLSNTSKAKPTIDDIVGDIRAERQRHKSPPIEQVPKKASIGRPLSRNDEVLPQIDLVQDSFAPLGGPSDPNNSSMWNMNTSRTTLPASRHAAALARLQRKQAERAERAKEGRNKENIRQY
ncbi:hypothetical protein OQA88_6162 [Cercophora sp. LCS_1]